MLSLPPNQPIKTSAMSQLRQELGRLLTAKKPRFAGRVFMAILLFLLWVPITVHCRLESLGMLPEYLACAENCSTEGTTPEQRADGCSVVESASYRLDEKSSDSASVQETAILFPHQARAACEMDFSTCQTIACPSPPLMAGLWRFVCRAASLPRAPSLG